MIAMTSERGARLLVAAMRQLGDVPGHEFHGNQWTSAGGAEHEIGAVTSTGSVIAKPVATREELFGKSHETLGVRHKGFDAFRFSKGTVTWSARPSKEGVKAVEKRYGAGLKHETYRAVDGVKYSFDPRNLSQHHRSRLPAVADSFTPKLSVAVRYALALGRRAARSTSDPAKIANVVRKALVDVLPATLQRAFVAGGVAGVGMLVKQLRAAGDVPGHEFHGNQWTEGQQGDHGVVVKTSGRANPSDRLRGEVEKALHDQPEWARKEITSVTFTQETDRNSLYAQAGTIYVSDQRSDYRLRETLSHEVGHVVDNGASDSKEFSSIFKQEASTVRGYGEKELDRFGVKSIKYFTSKKAETFAELYANALGRHTTTFNAKPLKEFFPKTYEHVQHWMEGRAKAHSEKPRTAESIRAAKDKPSATIKLSFNASNPRAARWAKDYGATLIKSIVDTTRERINEAIARSHEDGVDPEDAIAAAVGDEARAEVIARTESMRAVHAGQREGWNQAVDDGLLTGDEQRVWIVTADDTTCPECDALDGETAGLDGEYDGGYDGPPAHPNCRCTEGLA